MSQPDIGWAVAEIMGHRKLFGYVREQAVAGKPFLRIDIPSADHPAAGDPNGPFAHSPLHPAESIFGITPVAPAVCVAMAQAQGWSPVSRYDLPPVLREALPAGGLDDGDQLCGRHPDDEDRDAGGVRVPTRPDEFEAGREYRLSLDGDGETD
jgi:hypothetical protein